MKNLKNKKGFTLVELLAVIVVLAIVMGLAVVGITSVLDGTRKSAFKSDAKSYIQGARSLVNSEQASALLGDTTTYSPSCINSESIYIPLSAIVLESGGKSPYGVYYYKSSLKTKQEDKKGYLLVTTADPINANNYGSLSGYAEKASFVRVESTVENGNCSFAYKIFLTDGVKQLGTPKNPVSEEQIDSAYLGDWVTSRYMADGTY